MDIETFMDYIKPELLILIAVLYFIGIGLKKSMTMKDSRIPMALGICGIILAILWVLGTSQVQTYQEGMIAAFTAITQGILCAGCSVYANQLIKQAIKDD
jgi:hypothetical protein